MERTKSTKTEQGEQPIWWKKVGGGSLRLKNKIIKPGEKFQAKPSEIPGAFRNLLVPLESIPEEKKIETTVKGEKAVFTVRPKGMSTTLFEVVNNKGKVMNEKGLKKVDAEQLVKDLQA